MNTIKLEFPLIWPFPAHGGASQPSCWGCPAIDDSPFPADGAPTFLQDGLSVDIWAATGRGFCLSIQGIILPSGIHMDSGTFSNVYKCRGRRRERGRPWVHIPGLTISLSYTTNDEHFI